MGPKIGPSPKSSNTSGGGRGHGARDTGGTVTCGSCGGPLSIEPTPLRKDVPLDPKVLMGATSADYYDKTVSEECPMCNRSDGDMIDCDTCKKWYHYECIEMPKEVFDLYQGCSKAGFFQPFWCADCKKVLDDSSFGGYLRTMSSRVFDNENEIKKLNTKVEAIEEKIDYKNSKEFKEAVRDIVREETITIKADVRESFQRRKKVVMVHQKRIW